MIESRMYVSSSLETKIRGLAMIYVEMDQSEWDDWINSLTFQEFSEYMIMLESEIDKIISGAAEI